MALADPLWTELGRTHETNALYYAGLWRDIQLKERVSPATLTAEDRHWLDGTRRKDAPAIRGLSPEQLRAAGLKLFSWHCRHTAADLSVRAYTADQQRRVWAWFSAECAGPRWELLLHTVTGPHVHIARRDWTWGNDKETPGNV